MLVVDVEVVVVVVVGGCDAVEELLDAVLVTVVGGAASLRLQPLFAMSSLGHVVFVHVTLGLSAFWNQSKRQ